MAEIDCVYKILLKDEWDTFQASGEFLGTQLDLKDGYIHMSSTEEQMLRVKNKFYKDEQVYLLKIDLSKLDNLKYEPISNGDLYPHQYGKLMLEWVVDVTLI
jgi:uncharacterized protein (DUF952 family)